MKFITIVFTPNREDYFAREFIKYGLLFRETERFLPN